MKIPTGTSACVALVTGRRQTQPPTRPTNPIAPPGSTPRPYHTHKRGECQFIIGEEPDMADALTCCAPVPDVPDGKKVPIYCTIHAAITARIPRHPGQKQPTANELIRSLRKYIS